MGRSVDRKHTLEQAFRMNPPGWAAAAQKELDPDSARAPQSQNSAPGSPGLMETQDREGMLMQTGEEQFGFTVG